MTKRAWPLLACLVLALLALPAGAQEGDAAPSPPADPALTAIEQALEKGRAGTAVFVCELQAEQRKTEGKSLPSALRAPCAKAYRVLGDRFEKVGSPAEAKKRWRKAAELDPRLLDDVDFLKKLTVKVAVKKKSPLSMLQVTKRPITKKKPPKPKITKPVKPPEPPGPRGDQGFALGVGAGYDGLLNVVASWMYEEIFSVEVSVGILFRSLDTRIRVYGIKDEFTPTVGFGMTTTMGPEPRFDLELPMYEDLYRLGQSIHVDIGVSWKVSNMDIFGGLALITSLDQDHPDRLLFFPQFALQTLYYF
jgi:hypothetical protein